MTTWLDTALGIGLVWFFYQAWVNRKQRSRHIPRGTFASVDIANAVRKKK